MKTSQPSDEKVTWQTKRPGLTVILVAEYTVVRLLVLVMCRQCAPPPSHRGSLRSLSLQPGLQRGRELREREPVAERHRRHRCPQARRIAG